MVDLLKKTYVCTWTYLYVFITLLSLYFFYTSGLPLDAWLFMSKFMRVYASVVFAIFIARRVNLFKSIYVYSKIRLGEEGYSKLLIKSLFINFLLYFIMVYAVFIPNLLHVTNHSLLLIYIGIILVTQFINECIVFYILYNNKAGAFLLLVFINYFVSQMIVTAVVS